MIYLNATIKIKKTGLLIALIFCSGIVRSQSVIIPPSPNAASLVSGTQSQVSQYTGRATVNIPIYTIETGNFSLPISLSYNTGGVRVSGIASWCGLGWSLNAGGLVTRSVVGLPDESPDVGYNAFNIHNDDSIAENSPYTEANLPYSQYAKFALGKADGQPDQYYFSTPNVSGKIINSWSYGYTTQAGQKLSVGYSQKEQTFGSWANEVNYADFCGNFYNDQKPTSIDEWTLSDGYGNTYSFSEKEQMSSHISTVRSGGSAYHP